jgi:hypothetical protein
MEAGEDTTNRHMQIPMAKDKRQAKKEGRDAVQTHGLYGFIGMGEVI